MQWEAIGLFILAIPSFLITVFSLLNEGDTTAKITTKSWRGKLTLTVAFVVKVWLIIRLGVS